MCGRYTLTRPAREIADQFGLADAPDVQPRYNVAPTQKVLAVREDAVSRAREAVLLRWGLVPAWASDLSVGNRMLNARAETIQEKPSFRTAYLRRRCLIPADGFYEWQAAAGKKLPIHFHFRDGRVFAFAGLWERWHPPGVEPVESCTILTTGANELIAPFHDRMPVIIPPERYADWLDVRGDAQRLRPLLASWPAADMTVAPASPRVNNARYEGADCLLTA